MITSFFFGRRANQTRAFLAAMAIAAALAGSAGSADARMGGGFSSGSRGSRTFSMPPSTATAPRAAFPFQRSETPTAGPQSFGAGAGTFGQRRFGFGSGLAAGLLGAGVLGMLTGQGFFGGIGGLFSMLGFLIQIALIGGLLMFAFNYFRNRQRPAAYAARPTGNARSTLGGLGGLSGLGGLGSGLGARPAQAGSPVTVSEQDFAAFERTLSDLQYAYSREDFNALARLTTPEMLRHLGGDIEANRRQNLRNDLSDVRLLQGDLSEAWQEGSSVFATVAMRFALKDVMIDRTAGRPVSGDAERSTEVTEIWTFCRDGGQPWVLSAVQQSR